jgi:hypothetical protein
MEKDRINIILDDMWQPLFFKNNLISIWKYKCNELVMDKGPDFLITLIWITLTFKMEQFYHRKNNATH